MVLFYLWLLIGKEINMRKLTQRQLDILQSIADKIDSETYYEYSVRQFKGGKQIMPEAGNYGDIDGEDGIYLVPDEARWIGDIGEYMGNTFEHAKYNIGIFVGSLMN